MSKVFLVTGGLGFIGKHFIAKCLDDGHYVINVDVVNHYAADKVAMKKLNRHPNYQLYAKKIQDLEYLPECDYIVNFAADSHVDNSISSPEDFIDTNINGVRNFLTLLRKKRHEARPLFIQISTDEVYGDSANKSFVETDELLPSNPYSASKAAAEMLVKGWGRTYSIPYRIVRMSNVYGEHQYPEKLIPRTCMLLQKGEPATVHGSGNYYRTWLHTSDAITGILTVIDKGKNQEVYNICGNDEKTVIEIVEALADIIDFKEDPITFVNERIGQDIRYSLSCDKIKALGWKPKADFYLKLEEIVNRFNFRRFTEEWSEVI